MHRDIRLEGQLKWNCILGRGLDDKTVEVWEDKGELGGECGSSW